MNTANQPTSTSNEGSCNAMSGGGQETTQDRAVMRDPWWDEVGHLVDAFEAELAATPAAKAATQATQ